MCMRQRTKLVWIQEARMYCLLYRNGIILSVSLNFLSLHEPCKCKDPNESCEMQNHKWRPQSSYEDGVSLLQSVPLSTTENAGQNSEGSYLRILKSKEQWVDCWGSQSFKCNWYGSNELYLFVLSLFNFWLSPKDESTLWTSLWSQEAKTPKNALFGAHVASKSHTACGGVPIVLNHLLSWPCPRPASDWEVQDHGDDGHAGTYNPWKKPVSFGEGTLLCKQC